MKFIVALIASLFLSSIAMAADPDQFYSSEVKNWQTRGFVGTETKNAYCASALNFADGSWFMVIKDLDDGEMYLVIHNTQWNIGDVSGTVSTSLFNFYGSDNKISVGRKMYFTVLDKNTIAVRNIIPENFIWQFKTESRIEIIMPGTITNASIPLFGTTATLGKLGECVAASKGVNLAPVPKQLPGMGV